MEQVNVIGKNGVILEESYIFGIESEKIVATEPLKSQTGTKITYAEAIESRDNPDILYVEESYAAVNGIIAGEKIEFDMYDLALGTTSKITIQDRFLYKITDAITMVANTKTECIKVEFIEGAFYWHTIYCEGDLDTVVPKTPCTPDRGWSPINIYKEYEYSGQDPVDFSNSLPDACEARDAVENGAGDPAFVEWDVYIRTESITEYYLYDEYCQLIPTGYYVVLADGYWIMHVVDGFWNGVATDCPTTTTTTGTPVTTTTTTVAATTTTTTVAVTTTTTTAAVTTTTTTAAVTTTTTTAEVTTTTTTSGG